FTRAVGTVAYAIRNSNVLTQVVTRHPISCTGVFTPMLLPSPAALASAHVRNWSARYTLSNSPNEPTRTSFQYTLRRRGPARLVRRAHARPARPVSPARSAPPHRIASPPAAESGGRRALLPTSVEGPSWVRGTRPSIPLARPAAPVSDEAGSEPPPAPVPAG